MARSRHVAGVGTRSELNRLPTRRPAPDTEDDMAWVGGSRRRWQQLSVVAGLCGLLTALTVAAPGTVAAAPQKNSSATYLVQMALAPVVAYHGGVAGLPATAPARGHKIDPQSADVVSYVDHLKNVHDTVLHQVRGGNKLYDYTYSFDGFAAQLTADQAATLATEPGVVNVTKDTQRKASTSSPASFLGLDAPGGLWDQLGGDRKSTRLNSSHVEISY